MPLKVGNRAQRTSGVPLSSPGSAASSSDALPAVSSSRQRRAWSSRGGLGAGPSWARRRRCARVLQATAAADPVRRARSDGACIPLTGGACIVRLVGWRPRGCRIPHVARPCCRDAGERPCHRLTEMRRDLWSPTPRGAVLGRGPGRAGRCGGPSLQGESAGSVCVSWRREFGLLIFLMQRDAKRCTH